MKNISLISLLLILLTACSVPTPSPTVTVSPKPSASPLPSATATETLTPAPTSTSTVTPLPPITLVTSLAEMQAHPEQMPDGSTPEKRAAIAETLRQMVERGEIANFGDGVPNLLEVVSFTPNDRAPLFDNYYNVTKTSGWANGEKRPMRGVTLVSGGEGVVYGVQMVKQQDSVDPGFIWYVLTTPSNIEYEVESLFNQLPEVVSLPKMIKSDQCVDKYGAICLNYVVAITLAEQQNAITSFKNTGIIPKEMSDGIITFIMTRQGIQL